MILDIIAAFGVSVLAGMGVGGGALLVIYLLLVRSEAQLAGQGLNLLFFIFAALPALAVNLKKRRLDFKKIAILSIFGAVFALIGSALASLVDTSLLKKLFGAFLAVSGVLSLVKLGKG